MAEIPPAQLAILAKEDQGPKVNGIVIAFTAFAFICVILRFLTRIKFTRNLGLEDYFIAISMCFSIIMGVAQIEQSRWGNGKHMMFLDLVAAVWILKYLYISILAYCISLTLTKISILLQYRRIFSLHENRNSIYVVMGICVAYGIESVLTGAFTCAPVDAFWNVLKKPTARCINENALWYANAGLNVATDLLVAVLPVKAIWSLQIAMKQKIALIIILTLGWFVCVVSILRLHALVQLAQHPNDTTWYSAATAYWSTIEVNLAIVCASTPALKPLIVKVMPAFSSRRGTYGSTDHSGSGPSNNSKTNRSFQRLQGKNSASTMENHYLESGVDHDLKVLPAATYKGLGHIHVTQDFDQHSENHGRTSKSESQKNLVSALPSSYVQGGK